MAMMMIAVTIMMTITMLTCFILMLPTFVSGGWATESSGRMLHIITINIIMIIINIMIITNIMIIMSIMAIMAKISKPFIKGIDTNALDIIDSLIPQSSLLLRFSQCLIIKLMMMMIH